MLDRVDRALGKRYDCRFASTVERARALLRAGTFEVAVCNLEPSKDPDLGIAGEILRDYPRTATIVLMIGEDDPAVAERAFSDGAYGYLVEPFWPGQLLIAVMSALRRRQLEIASELRDQNVKDQNQTIIDMAPIGIYAKGTDGRYVVANQKAVELAGRGPGGLVGLTDEDFLPAEEIEAADENFREVLADGASHARETTVEIAGVQKTFKTIRFPLLGEEGEISAVGGISVEITAERESLRLRDELAATQAKAIDELRLSRQETIAGLTQAIELHDSSTGEHISRMAAITSLLATKLGLSPDQADLLGAAAPMHDVGKIGVAGEMLRKPGPLSPAERREMELHTLVGHKIFAEFESELARAAASIALTHHERFDGSGYPRGLVGEEIPIEGRITAVADVFDALLTDRSYRPALSLDDAVAVMREGKGSQFDPAIVDVLLTNLDEALAIRS
jgi:HD-GYP domain-containing protein (c-di-GMP phosphodiesterase class II)/CheY-like chemotaxis protein